MSPETLLSQLSDQLGVESFELNNNGVASLEFDGQTIVYFEPDADRQCLRMYATVCRWPESEAERNQMAPMFLEANWFGRGTDDFVFSLDADFNEIVLEEQFSLDSSPANDISERLGKFLNVIDIWTNRILPTATDVMAGSLESPVGLRV